MIISIEVETAFDKVHHPFIIKKQTNKQKTSPESGYGG